MLTGVRSNRKLSYQAFHIDNTIFPSLPFPSLPFFFPSLLFPSLPIALIHIIFHGFSKISEIFITPHLKFIKRLESFSVCVSINVAVYPSLPLWDLLIIDVNFFCIPSMFCPLHPYEYN